MDFKTLFQHKISIIFILLNIIIGLIGAPVPDTDTKASGVTEKPKMGCQKKFCTLFNGICINGGTCVSGDGCAGYCNCTKPYTGRYCQINGNSNGKSSDNGNGNGHDNGNGRSYPRAEKKPALGVIMKLFKGLRSNGNSSHSNAAKGGKTPPTSRVPTSSKPPVKPVAQKNLEIKTNNNKSGSERFQPVSTAVPHVNSDGNGNVNQSVTAVTMNLSGNASVSGQSTNATVNSTVGQSKRASTTRPKIEADQQNITRNKTNEANEVINDTMSVTVDNNSDETTTKDPGNVQNTEVQSPKSTTDVVNTATNSGPKTKSDSHSVKSTVRNAQSKPTMTDQTRLPTTKTNTKSTNTEAVAMMSKPEPNGSSNTTVNTNAGNIDHKTTSNQKTTLENTTTEQTKSDSDPGTVITKIIIGSSKSKPDSISSESTLGIPKLKNSEVSSSVIPDSAAVPLILSKGELLIRDIPFTTKTSDAFQQPRTDMARSAAQLWPVRKTSTLNEESAVPMVSSRNVKSTVDDANRWVASGFEPNIHSDIHLRENMALVLGKDFIKKEVQESKSSSGNLPVGQNGKHFTTTNDIAGLAKTTLNISTTSNELHNNTVFPTNEITPKMHSLMKNQQKTNSSNTTSYNRTLVSSEHSVVSTIRSFEKLDDNNSTPPLLDIISSNTRGIEEGTTSNVQSSTTESSTKLPEENIYLKAAVYKKFIPPKEKTSSAKTNNSSNVVSPTNVVTTSTKANAEHGSQFHGRQRVLETTTQASTVDRDTSTVGAGSETTLSVVAKDSDKITEVLGKTLKASRNDTGITDEDTTVTALEKLKSLLVYVQTILSSTKNDLEVKNNNNHQSTNVAQTKKENNTESHSNIAGSHKNTIPKTPVQNGSDTKQERINLAFNFSNQQQKAANGATEQTEDVETTTTPVSDSTTDGDYDTNDDTFVKIPIFQRISENISPTVDPVITTTSDDKSESSSLSNDLSKQEVTGPRRHISTSAMARILRKIYAIGNLITRPVKTTTTMIPEITSHDAEHRGGLLFTKNTSESSKTSNTFHTDSNKMAAINMKHKRKPNSPVNSNSDNHEHELTGYSKKDKYSQQNRTVKNEIDSFYGNEDMVGNFIVDSTSTIKPYTMPPTSYPEDELLHSNTQTEDSSLRKPQSDTKMKQRKKTDSVKSPSLDSVLRVTTVSQETNKSTIS